MGLLFGFCFTTLPTLTRLGDQLDDPRAPNPPYNRHLSTSRRAFANTCSGGAMGLVFVLVAGPRHVVLPLALGATVLVSSYVFQVPPYWRTAPTTAALVVASSLERESRKIGLESSLHRVAEVMLGSFMACGGRLRHGQDLGAAACETGRWARQVLRCGKIAVLQLQTHEHAGLAQTFVSCVLTIIAFADPKVCASPVLRYL